ncbi:hypothetical protein [Streptomyces sp. 184]
MEDAVLADDVAVAGAAGVDDGDPAARHRPPPAVPRASYAQVSSPR